MEPDQGALRMTSRTNSSPQDKRSTPLAAKNKKSKFWIWGGVAALVAAIILGVAVAARGSSAKIEPSQLAKVEKGDIARSVVATGKVQPITKVEVKSKASGSV